MPIPTSGARLWCVLMQTGVGLVNFAVESLDPEHVSVAWQIPNLAYDDLLLMSQDIHEAI